MYFSPHLEVICLIGKEIICRSYSPPRGRNPAAQPCTSNLKQKNKHFYPRSPSIFPLFSSEIQFKLKLVYVSTNRTTNFFFLKKKIFQMFLLAVYTRKKFGEISKSQSLFSFRGERRFRDSTLERRFLPFRNKRVESMRSPHYLAERSELTQQGRRSESKVRDGVKKRVGRRKRGSKKKKGFSFFSKESFPSLSLAARLGILSSSLRRGNVNFLLSLADPLRRRLLSFGFSSS